MSSIRCHTCGWNTASSALRILYNGSVPAVALSPSAVGRNGWKSRIVGLPAASR